MGVYRGTIDELNIARARHRDSIKQQWITSQSQELADWKLLNPVTAEVQSMQPDLARLERQTDGSFLAIGDISKRDEYIFQLNDLPTETTAVMIEAMTDPSMPKRGPGRTYYEGPIGDFFLSEIELAHATDNKRTISDAWVDFALGGREAAKAYDGDPLTGWSIDGRQGETHRMVIALQPKSLADKQATLRLLFERYYAAPLGRVRLWATTSANPQASWAKMPPTVQNMIVRRDDSAIATQEVERAFLDNAIQLTGINASLDQLRKSRPRAVTTLVMQARPSGFARATHRYHRGEFLNPRETVAPAVPKFLARSFSSHTNSLSLHSSLPNTYVTQKRDSADARQVKTRLQLAEWLTQPDHPLVARVLANRYWSMLMGKGIVTTEEDFGYQGGFPSHPQLIDWLADELVGQGVSRGDPELMWSLKRWMRRVVLSDAYARSSEVSAEALRKDPGNVYLARSHRRRLEAEQLRDAALASAQLLSRTLGGPSVYPPQPVTVTTEGTYGKLQWPESHGEARYRRAIYTFSKRTAPFAMLQTFDGPSGEACQAKREAGNTPLQALTLLNDVLFLEAAQELGYQVANSVASPAGSPDAIVRQLFHAVLLREPSAAELKELTQFYEQQVKLVQQDLNRYKPIASGNAETQQLRPQGQNDKATRAVDASIAAATLTARVLLNTDEFVTRD